MSQRCVFFDRDGVVNKHPNNTILRTWEDFRWMPGFLESLRLVLLNGYVAVVVTNQQGVGKGDYTAETVERLHAKMVAQLHSWGVPLLDVLYCPHLAADACECRKPKPGMLLEAACRHNLDLAASWMIGDQERDIRAGHAAGCRCVRVHQTEHTTADYRVESMDQLSALLDKIL